MHCEPNIYPAQIKRLGFLTASYQMEENTMSTLEKTVKGSFRMEMIGAGMYQALARQYRRRDKAFRPALSKIFRTGGHAWASVYTFFYGKIRMPTETWYFLANDRAYFSIGHAADDAGQEFTKWSRRPSITSRRRWRRI